MKLASILTETKEEALKCALELQRLLIDDELEAELEHDVRDGIQGVSVRFAPEMVVHIPFDSRHTIAFAHDQTGYMHVGLYTTMGAESPSYSENMQAIKNAHRYIVSIADSIRKEHGNDSF